MTVSYTYDVATGQRFLGNFPRLLFRWKGSIYKLVLPDLIIYILLYYTVNLVHRTWLVHLPDDNGHRIRFHLLVDYCAGIVRYIPVRFILAFYIDKVVSRWWNMYYTCPWPDSVCVLLAVNIVEGDERGRMMRRTIIRYINLCILFTFVTVSPPVRKRFPSPDHIVAAGLLMPHEKKILDSIEKKIDGPKYYVPIVWACAIATKARKEGLIKDDMALYQLIKCICGVRECAGNVLSYDWICIPLAYTQSVTLAVYIFFLAHIIADQQFKGDEDSLDVYVPIFDFFQFFFLMGWLKVGEAYLHPFGEDDDDFELNWLVDRNIKISYLIADEMSSQFPELEKDRFWDTVIPDELYYTKMTLKFKKEAYQGSAEAAEKKEKSGAVDSITLLAKSTELSTTVTRPDPKGDLFEHNLVPKEADSYIDIP